jgi:hypothetical protein
VSFWLDGTFALWRVGGRCRRNERSLSAAEFLESLLGKAHELFKDEDALRRAMRSAVDP